VGGSVLHKLSTLFVKDLSLNYRKRVSGYDFKNVILQSSDAVIMRDTAAAYSDAS
jgi:hypothetical protein